ncbi:beta strand repeat-containing protein [Pseudolactococcus reticulitermitis]|uniref:WxL domain-containing protein n=1 Tax=Pseudolactococcus reticulitermitis TaxID=2025039 RepID=A0A224X9U7_9LACT|nr:hypothetical protein [Lactococcus reticulitermitis]GAX48040.1 hypothetical protein RsY01_1654 [Lactococcus reticulitermitis]
MQRKNKFKLVTFAMLLALLPSMNFGAVSQAFSSGNVKQASLGKLFSPQEVGATTTSKGTLIKSIVPTGSLFNGKTASQPSRTPLPQRAVVDATAPSAFGWQQSISSLALPSNQVTAIQDGTVLGSYPATDAGVQQALYAMYSATGAATSDFVLYFGGNTTLSNATAKTPVTAPTASNMTFSTLAGHAKSLTWVSNPADNLASSNTGQASGTNYTVTLPTSTNTNTYFGVPTVFRNVTVAAGSSSIYAQGNAFATTNGSWITGAVNIYGGTNTTDITGDTNLYIGATGNTAGWSIYGGNASGGTISGTTHVTLTQVSSRVDVITGGNAAGGTISGDTNLDINGAIAAQVTSIYGGGIGTSASPVTVNGTVTTYVSSTNGSARYQLYQGGTCYGQIAGSIYNTLTGLGGWTSSSSNINGAQGTFSNYNGGSFQGNIGKKNAGNVISNSYDTSAFTTGQALFTGGNGGTIQTYGAASTPNTAAQGVTYANITNYIKSAFTTGTAGAVYGVVGGNGHDSLKISPAQWGLGSETGLDAGVGMTQAKAYAQMPASTVIANAQAITSNAIYGDIYTWMQSGAMSTTAGGGYVDWTGFAYGASSNGYLQGQSVLEAGTSNSDNSVGGAGVVYCTAGGPVATLAAKGKVAYGKTDTAAANNTAWDLWGGGGTVYTYRQAFLQNGDCYLIHNNDIARWTYGGQSNGSQVGDSYSILNGGIVDTLEGGGYTGTTRWGSTTSQVNMGQVNWFLSGGSWGDLYNTGNATVNVYNGFVNAIAGGNYGQAGNETIAGDSTVNVYGGDFSGTPRTGTKQLCGGPFYNGSSSILGNTTLNLDLTGPTGSTFQLPSGTYLSGGAGYNNTATHVGSGNSNNINVTIAANANSGNVLNGAIIYGDGQSNGANNTYTNVGTINMTINADGNTVGSIYATNYTAMPAAGQLYNANIEVGDGTTISGTVTAGGSSDNLTDAIAAANTKQSIVTLGDDTSHNPITIKGSLINFNSAEITSGTTVNVAGAFKNGGGATGGNHAATYSKHGTIQLDENATLAVTTTSSLISGSQLIVYPNASLSTPYVQTSGLINLSDLDMTTHNGNLFWEPTGTPPTNITTTYGGAYWGSQKGFPVLTFNGGDSNTKSGAANITPGNFSGVDTTRNYAFLGDYTMNSLTSPSNPTWIGYVVPGQIRVYNTTSPTNSGFWQHHLKSNITTGTPVAGQAMQAWASVGADTDASTMQVMYVMGYADSTVNPFSFTSQVPAYIKSRSASGFDGRVLNDYPAVNPNFDINDATKTGATRTFATADYFVGNQQNGSNDQATFGSYIIQNVVTDNVTSLSAGNYILPTTDAASLDLTQLQQIADLKGTGVMSDISVTNGIVSAINNAGTTVQNPISVASNGADKSYAQLPMTWTLGTSTAKTNLVVVPQAAVISADHQTAVNAYDAGMTGDDAHALVDQADFDANWTYALGFKADGTVAAPNISAPVNLISTLQTIVAGDPLIDVNDNIDPVTYTYNGVSKDITLNISFGFIDMATPTAYDFGTLDVSPKPLLAWAQTPSSDVTVTDTRTGSGLKPWQVTVKQSIDLQGISNGNNLSPYLLFKEGGSSQQITSAALQIFANTAPTTGSFNLNQNWNASTGQGIQLNIPVQSQIKGVYQGELTWTLNNVPTP